MPTPPKVSNARTVVNCNIYGREDYIDRSGVRSLSDDDVRYIRRICARNDRWIAWLDKTYHVSLAKKKVITWKQYERKRKLRRKLLDRYGRLALSIKYGVSMRTVYDVVERKTYKDVK